jgi:hypothetical protein
MQCNIDAKGKAARLMMGLLMTLAGVIVVLLARFDVLHARLWTYVAIALIAIGLFCIFEARAGWCALRAMGVKTRI